MKTTSNEGLQIDSLATTYGLQQIISDPSLICPTLVLALTD